MSAAEAPLLAAGRAPGRGRGWWRRILLSEYLVLGLTVIYVAALYPLVPEIATADTARDVLAAMMPLLVIAIGQTFVLIVAGIDLSATAVLALASVMGAAVVTSEGGLLAGVTPLLAVPLGIAAFVLVGGLVGAFNGWCATRLRMPAFIVTLTTMMFLSGAAILFTASFTDAGSSIGGLPQGFILLGQGRIGEWLPVSLLLAGAVAVAGHLVLSGTVFGRWLYAIGLNPEAARVSGVPVDRAVFWAFVISGVCAGLAALLYTGRLETGTPVLGQRLLLDVVGAAVIGGTSLFGGRGKITWTIGGVLFLTVVDKGLQLLGLSLASTFAIKGGVILLAAVLDSWRQQVLAQGPTLVSAPLLEVSGLRKSFFGVEVLKGIDFTLDSGRVLGLVGENGSGKSTTVNILGGVHRPDAGGMRLAGLPYRPAGPRDAEAAGIAFIHQELNLFRNLSVEENLFIGGFPKLVGGLPFIDRRAVRRRARELLAEVDLDIPPGTPLRRLSQGERQLVEIAKGLGAKARLMILDEPTTSLTARETARLFELIAKLKARGIAVIYISHILGDVRRLCDGLVVLRDGERVGGGATAEIDQDRLITMMVGRSIDQIYPARPAIPPGAPVLEVERLTQPGVARDIDLTVGAGEVVGIAGLMGAGRSELARMIFGLDRFASGSVRVDGRALARPSPAAAMALGMAFLTEDRRAEGLMMDAALADNIALPSLPVYGRGFSAMIERTRLGRDVERMGREVKLSTTELARTLAKSLSGGNQQKVVIGKWLLRGPRLFILDEPTRGIDVGAKYEVYKIINRLAEEGAGILMISSEIEELTGMCDRILVMSHGEIRARFERPPFDREAILRAAMRDASAHRGAA